MELAEGMVIEDGLVAKPCGFGTLHYVSTREQVTQAETDRCSELKSGIWTQAGTVAYLRHIPYCGRCLGDYNNYAFKSYMDFSASDMERLIALYTANYPNDVEQPILFPQSDRLLWFNFRVVNSSDEDDGHGEISLDTMEAEFFLYSECPDDVMTEEEEEPYYRRYDLSMPSGWAAMLEQFPQPPINVSPSPSV